LGILEDGGIVAKMLIDAGFDKVDHAEVFVPTGVPMYDKTSKEARIGILGFEYYAGMLRALWEPWIKGFGVEAEEVENVLSRWKDETARMPCVWKIHIWTCKK
jgi:hypothetical protein